MLNLLLGFSLKRRSLILWASLLIAVYGGMVASNLPIDVLPDLNRPRVTIMTEVHGLVPEDVECLVTRHIENAVAGAAGVERVRSTSSLELSTVVVEFAWDTDVYRNRQVVQEKMQLAKALLPADAQPQMAPISSLMGQVQLIGLRSRSGQTPANEIRALAVQSLRLRLLALSGVSQVVVNGGAARQLQVTVDLDRLLAHGLLLTDIEQAIQDANQNASGGVLELASQGPLINVKGLLLNAEDLANAVIREGGPRPLHLADVAKVEFGPAAVRTGDAGVNGQQGIIMVVLKQPGQDTMALTRRIDQELELLRPGLPEDIELLPGIYRQADFIQRAVDNVSEAVRDGAILVLLVLFLFLLNLRSTLITLTAIPMSVAVTAIVFQLLGISINTMTLGGLAVAVGALVDDAIVDVENVFRRLRQNKAKDSPLSVLTVVFRASSEVRRPILIGTLVVTVVYVPLFALSGMEGRLFAPIGLTYIVSIMASLLVSLTLTPVLCFYLLPKSAALASAKDSWLVRKVKAVGGVCINFSMAHAYKILVTVMSLVLVSLVILGLRATEFLPPFNEGSAQVNLILPAGTSLQTSDAYGQKLETTVLAVEGVTSVGRRTGRAEGDEHAMDVNISEMIVNFDSEHPRSRQEMLADIRARVNQQFPGVASSTEQPFAHMLSHLLSGVYAQVAIKIKGEDLAVLRNIAKQAEQAVASIPGVTDLMVEQQNLVTQVMVQPRRRALAEHGFTVSELGHTVELAMEGAQIDRLNLGAFSYPIILRLREEDRQDIQRLRHLPVVNAAGKRMLLADLAEVTPSRTPNAIKHENSSRQLVVQHNVQGRALGEVATDVERALAGIRKNLPTGYSIALSGQFEAQAKAAQLIYVLSLISLVLMGMILFSHFRCLNLVLQTLVNVPAAFLGAAIFLILTDQTMSVATLVGFISLGGIAARNKILLLDHYLHLVFVEGEKFSAAMILRAGQERIVPVLMTALTSGIALVPLVWAPEQPGRELLYPVASVIVGGLMATTLWDLLLSPGLFWLFGENAVQVVRAKAGDSERQEHLMFDNLEPETF